MSLVHLLKIKSVLMSVTTSPSGSNFSAVNEQSFSNHMLLILGALFVIFGGQKSLRKVHISIKFDLWLKFDSLLSPSSCLTDEVLTMEGMPQCFFHSSARFKYHVLHVKIDEA